MAKSSTFVATLKFIDSFSGGFSKAMRNMDKETKNFQKQMKALNELGTSISNTGKRLTVGLTLPIVGLGVKATQSAMSYEKSLNQIMTLKRKFASNGELDLNDSNSIEEFKNKAKSTITDLSNTYGRTQEEIADSYYILASAFNDTSKMEEALNTSLQMSIAGNVEAGETARALATIYNAYGGSIEEIGDKIGATVNFGFTTYEELAESLGTVVPTAAQAGVSLDDLATSMAVITSTGVSTAEATTYLKNAMNQIIKTGGIGEIKDGHFLEYLQELEETMPEIEDQMKVFTNIRARSGITALVGNTSLYEEYSKQIKNASGTLKEMNAEMLDSSTNQFTIATTRLNNILEKFGEKILPTVNKYLEKFEKWLSELDISEEDIDKIIRWGGALALAGPALTLLGTALKTISTLGTGLTTATTFFNSIIKAKSVGALEGAGQVLSNAGGTGAVTAGTSALSTVAGVGVIGSVAMLEANALKKQADEATQTGKKFYMYGGMPIALPDNASWGYSYDENGNLNGNGNVGAGIENFAKRTESANTFTSSNTTKNMTVNIPKLADTINASDPNDIDTMADKLANAVQGAFNNQ